MGVLDRVPILYVSIDGARAPVDLTRAVMELTVDEHEKKACKITLKLDDPTRELRAMLPQGTVIAVRWGYVGDLSAPRGGIVHKIKGSYDDETVVVEAFGRELALSRGAVRRTLAAGTLREHVETLARDSGLRVRFEAEDTIRFDGGVVDDESAWAWILHKTAELGLIVTTEDDTIVVREPPLNAGAAHVLLWGWRNSNVISFEVEENTKKGESENEGVVAVFVDPASGQVLQHAAGAPNTTRATLASRRLSATRAATARTEGAATDAYVAAHPDLASQSRAAQTAAWAAARTTRASSPSPPTEDDPAMLSVVLDTGEVRPDNTARAASTSATSGASPTATDGRQAPTSVPAGEAGARQHLRRVAEGAFKAHERGKVKAKATCEGIPRAARADLVRVLGVAERDAGLWYAEGVKHTINDSGYETEWEFKRDGVNAGAGTRRRGAATASGSAATGAAATSGAGTSTTPTVPVDLNREAR